MEIGMKAGGSLGRDILTGFYLAPWAWLVCFAVFTATVTLEVGHFPSYSNPDPKHVHGLHGLYQLNVILLLLALLSPLVIGAYAGWTALRQRSPQVGPAAGAAYALGLALMAAILLGNAFGLGNWLFD
jgi:hypothetical protein